MALFDWGWPQFKNKLYLKIIPNLFAPEALTSTLLRSKEMLFLRKL